jgi:hypothetical protein
MEFLTILLSGLLAVTSTGGFFVDNAIENAILDRVKSADTLEVRIDNAPSWQIIQGKIESIKIASRGLQLTPEVRIDTFELETDPLSIDLDKINTTKIEQFRQSLRQPLQGGVRLVVTEEDINRSLASPEIKKRAQEIINRLITQRTATTKRYEIVELKIDFLENKRLGVQLQLKSLAPEDLEAKPIDIQIETGVNLVKGKRLELIEPMGTLDGRRLSRSLLASFANKYSSRLDLQSLEARGLTVRILEMSGDKDRVEIVTFFRLESETNL